MVLQSNTPKLMPKPAGVFIWGMSSEILAFYLVPDNSPASYPPSQMRVTLA